MLRTQKSKDKLLVLRLRYNRNMKIRRPTTDNEIAVYGNGVFIVIYRNVLRLYFACKIEIFFINNGQLKTI